MARTPSDPIKGERTGSVSDSTSGRQSPAFDHAVPRSVAKLSRTQSPVKSSDSTPHHPNEQGEEVISAEIVVKMEPGKAPKLARTASQKVISKTPTLFLDEPNSYSEATSSFQVIESCSYANKNLGITEPALECDCAEEWDAVTKTNHACGEDSDCINRATKMECTDDCGCGSACQNQRFQQKQWAKVTVFKTEKKGYGLRADTDLRPGEFIFEYIGEVINEPAFRRRMRQYDDEGIKHFYFMSLTKGEFVDATKRGNLGRFCNHSCNPNCYVDKWVIGERLRMGIFAERNIKRGEELVFNYNVDRYGADPQPCYCAEPNCTGYIGGKTQTERGTKLSNATIEALGIDDYNDWEFAVAKKPRKPRKTGENDEEYVNDVQPKSLEEDGVTKVMAALMQCKEKWIAVKLLGRIQRAEDEKVTNRVVRMHGYRILKTALSTFLEDTNVCLQVLDILFKLPRITRNKIQDSKIEEVVEKLKESENERVVKQATEILDVWSKLEVGYRIPRMKRDPNAVIRNERPERRDPRERSRSRSRSETPVAPTGPKNMVPQRNPGFYNGPRQPFRRGPPAFGALPPGWFTATANGRLYYYSASGQTTWTKPVAAASQPPPPPKELTHEEKLQQIINNITKNNNTPKDRSPAVSTPQATPSESRRVKKEEKWRSLSEEKQKKLYENALFPHISYVINKYKHKLPREDIKRFGKEVSKKLVNSDYKNGRVSDPTHVSSKHAKSVKKFAKEYFDKAVIKHREHEERKRKREAQEKATRNVKSTTPDGEPLPSTGAIDVDDEVKLTDDEMSDNEEPAKFERAGSTESSKKRKRDSEEDEDSISPTESSKKFKNEDGAPSPPPPPPPPPPTDSPGEGNGEASFDMLATEAFVDTKTEASSMHPDRMEMCKHESRYDAPELSINGPRSTRGKG